MPDKHEDGPPRPIGKPGDGDRMNWCSPGLEPVQSVLREHLDCFAVIGFDAEGRSVGVELAPTPLHISALAEGMRNWLAAYDSDRIAPGGWLPIINDDGPDGDEAWKGGGDGA